MSMRKLLASSVLFGAASTIYLGCSDSSAPPAAKPPAAAAQPAAQAAAATIAPDADRILRRMSQFLASQNTMQLHSTATSEQRLDDGQLVQVSRDSLVTLQRPDKLHARVRRGGQVRQLWHHGKDLTVLDMATNKYASLQTPEPVGQMIDFLADQYGIIIPLDDLLYPNPYANMTERVTSGVLVDQQSVEGNVCDHLLFTQENVDWQIWIDKGEQAVPRRVVITYKGDGDQPQYEAVLSSWKFALPAGSVSFTPQLPAAAQRVEVTALQDSDHE